MTTSDLSPDDAETRAGLGGLGLVYVCNLLSEIKVAAFLLVHIVNFKEGSVVIGVAATSEVTKDGSLYV